MPEYNLHIAPGVLLVVDTDALAASGTPSPASPPSPSGFQPQQQAGGVDFSQLGQTQQYGQPPQQGFSQPQGQPQSAGGDPWDNAPAAPAQAGSAPQSTGYVVASPENPPANGVVAVTTPNGDQTWTCGRQGAPLCKHNQPAAYVEGIGKPPNRKPWAAWRCALGCSQRWKEKCDYSEFA